MDEDRGGEDAREGPVVEAGQRAAVARAQDLLNKAGFGPLNELDSGRLTLSDRRANLSGVAADAQRMAQSERALAAGAAQ